MNRIPLETHYCIICGLEFEDEIHPNDDPLCGSCLQQWHDEVEPYDFYDEIVMAEVAYAAYYRGEE